MATSRLGILRLVTCVLAASVPFAAAAEPVQVLREISFSKDAKVRQAVKDECGIQTDLPKYIDEFSNQVELVDGALRKGGRVLDLKIIAARATGGGAFSGGKWVTVEGVLTENGRKIGNFMAKRLTIGYWNFSACSAARRCSRAVGRDIAEWLENPQMNSKLGTL